MAGSITSCFTSPLAAEADMLGPVIVADMGAAQNVDTIGAESVEVTAGIL